MYATLDRKSKVRRVSMPSNTASVKPAAHAKIDFYGDISICAPSWTSNHKFMLLLMWFHLLCQLKPCEQVVSFTILFEYPVFFMEAQP